MRRYESYKPSGVEWLGEIPSHWDVKRNIGVFDERKESNQANMELLSVTINRGIIKQDEITAKKDSSNEDKSKYKVVRKDDLAYNKMRMWQGAIGASDYDGIVSPAYIVLRPRDTLYSRYFHYLYRTEAFINEANRHSYGLCLDMNSLRYEDFKTIYSPIPPRTDVERIVNFLDQKTAEIDAAIAKKQRLIELLQEQKSILINQAVTRGLNPNVAMRDSGVDWIGEIPIHWELKKVKHVAHVSPSKTLDQRKRTEDIVSFLPMEKIGIDGTYDDNEGKIVKTVYDGFTYFAKGDVVIAKITPCFENGKGAWLNNLSTEFGFGTTELHVLRPKKIYGDFLFQLLNRKSFLTQGEEFMVGSAGQKRVPTEFVANYLFGCPPIQEQLQISEWINEFSKKISKIITTAFKQNELLIQTRSLLISEIVTGKIKV